MNSTNKVSASPFFASFYFMTISIMYWNVQGAVSANFQRSFRTIIKNYNPSMVVLMEPRISGVKADEFIKKSRFDQSHRVEAVGFSGGIWLLWQSSIEVVVLLNHRQFIHFKICMNKAFVSWGTAVYANPNPMLRRQLWKHMDSIATSIQGPWIIGGDFNSILYASEKQGGVTRNSGVCENFL